jgi:mono/diheme cytochrome c family protein
LGSIDDRGIFILEDQYVENALKVVGSQLSRAGVRLAFVLNDALATSGASAAPKAKRGSPVAGKEFAQVVCSVCHVVTADQRNPNEAALAPDFQAVANTRGISETALRSFLFGSHPSMPDMKLSQRQGDNLIAYILSLRTAP